LKDNSKSKGSSKSRLKDSSKGRLKDSSKGNAWLQILEKQILRCAQNDRVWAMNF